MLAERCRTLERIPEVRFHNRVDVLPAGLEVRTPTQREVQHNPRTIRQ